MIRVLLVDDQSMVRTGFRTILESEDGISSSTRSRHCPPATVSSLLR